MTTAIIMMAGKGSRMNLSENKVFLKLGTKMVFEYSLNLFLDFGCEVVCVIKEEDRHYLKDYFDKVKIVEGGITRQESVYNGLLAANGDNVLIHDAARPFLSKKVLAECLSELEKNNAVLVVSPCKDSIYEINPLKNLKRDELRLAQTPQGGNKDLLLAAHKKAIKDNFVATDDISLLLNYQDQVIKLIESDDKNFKITTQLDLVLARELVKCLE